MQDKKGQLVLAVEQWTGSKLGKEYVKAVYCQPTYLIYMLSTSCKMLDWIKYKLGFKEAEKPQIKVPICARSWRKQGNSRKTSTSISLSTLKPLTVCITTNCGKF